MLQPVTKVILTRKPKLHVERNSFVEQQEVNPEQNVKKKCQKSKCQLFPLAVTSITNHENIKGDNSPLLQHHNWLSPSVPLQNQAAFLKTRFRASLNEKQSDLALQRNLKKSSEKSLILKAQQEVSIINGGRSKKNMKMNILNEKLLDEEQTNSAPKRKKLEYFSNCLHAENNEDLENRNILSLPHLPKNCSPNQQQLSSTGDYLLRAFVKETDNKTKSRLLQEGPEEELKRINGWNQIESNLSMYSNSLPKIKSLPKNSVWNCLNGSAHYPHRRNLLLDWYTYDICCPLSFQSWPSVKEKSVIEIVGTQVALQGLPRNPAEEPFIFTQLNNETQSKILQDFNGVNIAQCFNESRYEASSSNQICSELNGRFSQNPPSHDSFLQETDSCVILPPKKIRKLPKRMTKTKQLSPIPTHTILSKITLKDKEKQDSVWNHFAQQKPIQLPMSILNQFQTEDNTKAEMQNNQNLNLNIEPEFNENLSEEFAVSDSSQNYCTFPCI